MSNYTISRIIRSEGGGTITARNQTGVMTITPNPGYVVGHADFSHGSLPSSVSSVVFATVGTAFTVSATVTATVTIASDFTMPSNDTTIDIPINGNARRINAENVNNTTSLFLTPISATIGFADTTGFIIENATSSNPSVSVTSTGTGSNTVITLGGNVGTPTPTGGSGSGDPDNSAAEQEQVPDYEEIGSFDVNATGDEVLDETDLPSFATSGFQVGQNHQLADALLFNTKSVTQNSNGEVTGATIAIVANIKSGPILPVDALTIEATGKSRTAQSTIPVIKNLKFGEGNISEFGETRKLQVFGDIGATFDLDVVDSSGTSVLDVDDAVIVKTGNLDSGESVYEKDVVIPAGTADKTYSVTITEKGSTVRGSALGDFHKGFPTRFTKKQADSSLFTLKFTRQSSPLYSQPAESTLEARFDVAGATISDLRALSLPVSDTLSGNVVKVTREITTSDNSSWQTSQSSINSNLVLTNKTLFITTTGNDDYDSSKVSIVNLSGVLSNSGGTNDKLTLTFTLLFKSLGDSDLTYNINIPAFITSNSGGTP